MIEIIENRALLFKTLTPEIVLRTVPNSTVIDSDGTVLVPWTHHAQQTLAYLGLPFISPISRDYDFSGPYEPAAHQLLICNMVSMHKKGYCFADMGMGKTASLIWATDYLKQLGIVKKVLVIAPKIVCRSAWQHEISLLLPYDTTAVLDGTAAIRKRRIDRNAQWDIINYDGVQILEKELANRQYDMVIVDESTAVKNPDTARWKFLNEVTKRVERVWLLSASPTPQGPEDAFGQIMLLTPELVPRNKYEWRNMTMQIGRQGFTTRTGAKVPPKWEPKDDSAAILKRYFVPALRLEKRDWVDLPTVFDIYKEVQLSTQQEAEIKKLHRAALKAVIENEEAARGIVNKIYQISSGCLYTTDEEDGRQVVQYDMQPKVDAVIELIEEAKARHSGGFVGGKTVVYVSHRHVCDYLTALLGEKYRVAQIHGDTKHRSVTLRAFETSDEFEIIVAVSSAMSHGVTAIAANTIIWFTPASATETFIQANERTDRIGQRQEGRRYYLFSTDVERERHEHLQRGGKAQQTMLSLYKTFMESM